MQFCDNINLRYIGIYIIYKAHIILIFVKYFDID